LECVLTFVFLLLTGLSVLWWRAWGWHSDLAVIPAAVFGVCVGCTLICGSYWIAWIMMNRRWR
jgi:hypothetical protein